MSGKTPFSDLNYSEWLTVTATKKKKIMLRPEEFKAKKQKKKLDKRNEQIRRLLRIAYCILKDSHGQYTLLRDYLFAVALEKEKGLDDKEPLVVQIRSIILSRNISEKNKSSDAKRIKVYFKDLVGKLARLTTS